MSEWLEHMPAIPLARGVPVVRGVLHSVVTSSEPLRLNGAIATVDPAWRVDLDDAGGFAYALRYAMRHCDPSVDYLWRAFSQRWLLDCTSDTERLALAQALQEVTP